MKDYRPLINKKGIPKHVAIIMDGNGRWAKQKSLPRSEGHRQGTDVIEPVMDAAIELGIEVVSIYAFSTENWTRPRLEVMGLWNLLEDFFKRKLETIIRKGIRVRHSGITGRLPLSTKKAISDAIEATKKNKKIVLNLCINYGSRQEILKAVNDWLEDKKENEKLTDKKLEKYLYTAGFPDVDLLIRTSGEYRISNYLLWQIAYAELYFTDILWPDYKPEHLYEAVYIYQQRERRFGGL
jgi:undecaprenyl diphosphate synthase